MHPEHISRISRVKEIKEGDGSTAAAPAKAPAPITDRAEIEKGRQLFLENFMRKLP